QARPPDLSRPSDDTGRQTGRQDQEAQVREADLPASEAPSRSLRSHRSAHPHLLPGRLRISSDKCNTMVDPVQVSGHRPVAFPSGSRRDGPLYNGALAAEGEHWASRNGGAETRATEPGTGANVIKPRIILLLSKDLRDSIIMVM